MPPIHGKVALPLLPHYFIRNWERKWEKYFTLLRYFCPYYIISFFSPFSLFFFLFFFLFSFSYYHTIFWYLPHYFPGILDLEDPKLFPYLKIHSALKKLFQKRVHGMTFQYIQSFSKSGIRLDSKFDIRPARYWELDIPDILNIQRKFMTNF